VKTHSSRLRQVDWSFSTANTQGGPHGIHPYPAKFIPQIPRQLLSLFSLPEKTVVLDPFCGSGTTLVEAMLAGLPSIGIDLSPLACLIAKVKTTPLMMATLNTARAVRCAAELRLKTHDYEIPDIPRINHWFRPEIQEALAALIAAINCVSDQHERDALRVAFSSIVVRVSNQESDTRYAAVEKAVTPREVFALFEARALNLIRATFAVDGGLLGTGPTPHIINQDILTVTAKQIPRTVGLVVTSPPYPNAYEYWLYHKYRMYWLGMDPVAVREREIGARPHFFKKNGHTPRHFLTQMATVFSLLSQVMHRHGVACFLIGRSIIGGKAIDNLALLQEAAQRHRFVLSDQIERTIRRTRKAFNLSHAAIEREHIAVFGREQ